MGIILRDYQDDMIGRARERLRKVRRVLIQAPTGAGKTILAAYMTSTSMARGLRVWFICHRDELVAGTSNTFRKNGIPHGVIKAGYPMDVSQLVQVCGIDTLKNRLHTLPPPDLVIWDECHHIAAAGWAAVMAALSKARHVGLSATPIRLDGQGLDDFFDDIVLGPTLEWLMDHDHLAKYRLFAPSAPDMKGVRKRMGDYSQGETAERADKPKLIGDMIKHWANKARGMRSVAFAVNVKHSLHIAESFTAAGIPFAHLDGNTDKSIRKKAIQDFATGRLMGLSNVGLFGEGFDLAAIAEMDVQIDAVIDGAPTMSLSAYMQRGGRMLRPNGLVKVYLDHAGNSARHGFFEDERDWSLQGVEKGGKGGDDENVPPPPRTCPECFMQIKQPAPPKCPHCGFEFRVTAKTMEVEDGELQEVTETVRKATRQEQMREQEACRTLQELVYLAQRRGYKSPQQWAFKVWSARMGRRSAVA